jgi:ribosomal protein S18 acetylase RimI-like enzyme
VTRLVAELYALYVKPGRQRQRFGRRLTRALVDELIERGFRSLLVAVLEANRSGRVFYESIGRKQVGTQPLIIGGDSYLEVFYGWPAIQDAAV